MDPSAAEPHATYDVAVVGGGAAGLHVALEAADGGGRVCLISRKTLSESASFRAQGGLAAAIGDDDSPARHAEDTLLAGRELCDPAVVRILTEEAPAAVEGLMRRGVRFDLEDDGSLALGLEGGHTRRRIVHAGGAETGRALSSTLARLAAEHPLIEVLEGASALSLHAGAGRCHGVLTDRGSVSARATVLATGGGAALWARSTNPRGAIGAGAVLAHQAGAVLADLELCQFHPTAVALPGSRYDGALISEALRGEGAVLLDAGGERFTDELAPRDQVSTAILERMAEEGTSAVTLDLRGIPADRFPAITAMLRSAGLDPERAPVPVAPASHYLIGGVRTDPHGHTSLAGLFAVGEAGCTGLHGANRLASNSLSECFVFGSRAARAALESPAPDGFLPDAGPAFVGPSDETRAAVWALAGPERDRERLERLRDDPYPLARLIAVAALARRETRGVHARIDYPATDPGLDHRHLLVGPDGETSLESWAAPVG